MENRTAVGEPRPSRPVLAAESCLSGGARQSVCGPKETGVMVEGSGGGVRIAECVFVCAGA